MGNVRWLRLTCIVAVCFLFLANDGCDSIPEASRQQNEKFENVETLMKRQPTPKVEFSLDRYLLSERLKRFNDPNKMSYLYVTLPDGTWLQVTIVGKLASTSKRLTSPEMLGYYSGSYHFTQAPDEMGTWGSSEPAKVGMTTLGSLVEIGGFLAYIYSETPLNFKNLNKPMVELTVVATEQEKAEMLKRLETLKGAMR